MSRTSRFLVVTIIVLFLPACNFVTQPIKDTPNPAETAQAMVNTIPAETLEAFTKDIPADPDVEKIMNPQGAPLQEWRHIPIMPEAVDGQEFVENHTYRFTANVTLQDVKDFYNTRLTALGWEQPQDFPVEWDGGFMISHKGDLSLTISITSWKGHLVITLSL